jgi:CRP-like cAMP-binding protein
MSQLDSGPTNNILAALPEAESESVGRHLTLFELPKELRLFGAGDPIRHLYFPRSGVISLVVPLESGDKIEVAMVGRDGVVGGSYLTGSAIWLNTATVQIPGSAWTLDVAAVRELDGGSASLRSLATAYEQTIVMQAQQSAACNAVHEMEARLCRWLLRCSDAACSQELAITQDYMAQMLGVRRTTVTLVAGDLQAAGLIAQRRGHVRLLDTAGLKSRACECYAAVNSRSEDLKHVALDRSRASLENLQ